MDLSTTEKPLDLTKTAINSASVSQFNLVSGNFSGSKYTLVDLSTCDLSKSIFKNSVMNKCDFQNKRSLNNTDFTNSRLSSCNFTYITGVDANFSNLKADNLDMKHAFIPGANFEKSRIKTGQFDPLNLITPSLAKPISPDPAWELLVLKALIFLILF